MGICVEDSVTNRGAVIFHVELTCLLIGTKKINIFSLVRVCYHHHHHHHCYYFVEVLSPALPLMGVAVSNIML